MSANKTKFFQVSTLLLLASAFYFSEDFEFDFANPTCKSLLRVKVDEPEKFQEKFQLKGVNGNKIFTIKNHSLHGVKRVRIRSYSVTHFSRIFPHSDWYSVRMRENPGKMRIRITPNMGSFYAVLNSIKCDDNGAYTQRWTTNTNPKTDFNRDESSNFTRNR